RFAADAIAPSPLGRVLAIAERLDTLAGGFAAGLKPTGNKDPFALRRNALGLARTLIESGIALDLRALLARAAGQAMEAIALTGAAARADAEPQAQAEGADVAAVQSHSGHANTEAADALFDFVLDRLRGYYADKAVPVQHFN